MALWERLISTNAAASTTGYSWKIWAAPVASLVGMLVASTISAVTVFVQINRNRRIDECRAHAAELLATYMNWAAIVYRALELAADYHRTLSSPATQSQQAISDMKSELLSGFPSLHSQKYRILLLDHDQSRRDQVGTISNLLDRRLLREGDMSLMTMWDAQNINLWQDKLRDFCEDLRLEDLAK